MGSYHAVFMASLRARIDCALDSGDRRRFVELCGLWRAHKIAMRANAVTSAKSQSPSTGRVNPG